MTLPNNNHSQKPLATTQKFTEIIDIIDSVVVMQGGNACMVLEVVAANFALLSPEEQQSKLFAYAGLLNSLSFPVQILVRNKRVDVSSYVKELAAAEAQTHNALLAKHIHLYKEFVGNLVKVNVVLNKTFYMVLPFSALEAGLGSAKQMLSQNPAEMANFAETANKILRNKAETLRGQINKFALSSKILNKEELTQLYYGLYNDQPMDLTHAVGDASITMIKHDTEA